MHPKAQQKIMGHSDIAMTMKYSHFAKEDLANAMLLLEDELCMSAPKDDKKIPRDIFFVNQLKGASFS